MIIKKRALEILKILESDIDDDGIIYTDEELDFVDYCSKNFIINPVTRNIGESSSIPSTLRKISSNLFVNFEKPLNTGCSK